MIAAIIPHTYCIHANKCIFLESLQFFFLLVLEKAALWRNKTKHVTESVFSMLVNHFYLSNTKFT